MMVRAALMLLYALISLIVFLLPNMTHPKLLFGVVVPDGFRTTDEGKRAIKAFRTIVALSGAAGLLALALLSGSWFMVAIVAGPLGTAAVTIAAFVRLNRRLQRFAVPVSPVRQLELAAEPEHLPWFAWLGWIPVLLLPACAVYLHMHWNSIPERFPVHWDLNGQPNGWAVRSVRGVYGPLVFGGGLTLWLFAFALASWYGTRRSEPIRRPMLVLLIVTECIIGVLLGRISLLPLAAPHQGPAGFASVLGWVLGVPLVFLAAAYLVKRSRGPNTPLDPTPAECWKGGMFYYNPNDAALFVSRRDSVGLTLNLANRWGWVMTAALLLLIASGFLFFLA